MLRLLSNLCMVLVPLTLDSRGYTLPMLPRGSAPASVFPTPRAWQPADQADCEQHCSMLVAAPVRLRAAFLLSGGRNRVSVTRSPPAMLLPHRRRSTWAFPQI